MTLEIDETATCACGAVTVTATGPVLSMLLCSCRDCRKATGTGHAAAVLMREETVHIAGALSVHARAAESGATLARAFCPSCGTPIVARTTRASGLVLLPAGLFDEPSWFAPSQAIFSRSHLDWDTLDAALPRHETYRDGGF